MKGVYQFCKGVTMFEKEAEEYGEKDLGGKYLSSVVAKDKLHAYKLGQFDGFVAGAEFGYNKANEWHKADVPTSPINKIVLGYIKDYNSKSFCLVKWNGEWWYDARTWNDKVKLIAWKEIVLPKESE